MIEMKRKHHVDDVLCLSEYLKLLFIFKQWILHINLLYNTIVWVFLNCFKWYLYIMHALNKLISTEISFVKSA